MNQLPMFDVAVIGGGLAGLTAAILAGRAGQSVILFERGSQPGGRASTQSKEGFHFNQGPRALYRAGEGVEVLRELGISQVVPYFGVFMFLPSIITSLGIESGFWQTQSVNLFLLVGGIVGILTINLTGRRTYTLISFSLLAASTLAIGLWQSAPTVAVIGLFAVFALVSSAMSALDTVYPSEMFPTEVRSTANGICVAASRIGAAVGVLLLPLGVSALGAHTTVLITAGIAALGLLVSIAWAPETAGKSLGNVADSEEDRDGAHSTVHAL